MFYGFENAGDLRGWNVDGAASLVDDTGAARSGERSLGVVIDVEVGGQRVDIAASLRELSHPPRFTLADATLTRYVHARRSADGSTLLGTMITVDAEGRVDQGSRVAITDDRWTALTMVVGPVDEPSADGRPVRRDDGFDGRDVVAFGVRVRASTGQMPPALNIDDCNVRPAEPGDAADTAGAGVASGPVADAPPVAAPVNPAPGSVPERAPTPPADPEPTDGRRDREPTGDAPDDDGGDDDATDAAAVRYGFEGDHPRQGWTARGATLRVDRGVARRGDRSLVAIPGP